jgi:hypothetical protein
MDMNLNDCSNYNEVLKRAKHYYGNDVVLLPSTRATKKYMIFNPICTLRWNGLFRLYKVHTVI